MHSASQGLRVVALAVFAAGEGLVPISENAGHFEADRYVRIDPFQQADFSDQN
jgi:hypothetical protein